VFSPIKVQSKVTLMVKDYQLKVSITVPVTGVAPESGAVSMLTERLGITPPRIDRRSLSAVSYFHSISAASYFADPTFSIESVVGPSYHR